MKKYNKPPLSMKNTTHTLTIAKLRKAIRGLPPETPVYTRDHDHGTYETNGLARTAEVLNQQEEGVVFSGDGNWRSSDIDFAIQGTYLVIGV